MRGLTKVLAGVAAIVVVAGCSSSKSKSAAKSAGELKTVSGGTTTLQLDPSFVTALDTFHLSPSAFGTGGFVTGGSETKATFPITGGNVTVDSSGGVGGELDHKGSGLTFTSGARKVTAKDFVLHLGKDPNLTGEIDLNGAVVVASLRLFDVDTGTLDSATITGGAASLKGMTLYLSAEAAADLNAALGTTLSGDRKVKIGTATIAATGS